MVNRRRQNRAICYGDLVVGALDFETLMSRVQTLANAALLCLNSASLNAGEYMGTSKLLRQQPVKILEGLPTLD